MCGESSQMAFQDLREFIAFLEKRGQLQRINAPVSNDLEITEITDRVSQGGRSSAALRERARLRHARAHQHLRQLRAHVLGARRRESGRVGRAHHEVARYRAEPPARGHAGEGQAAARTGGTGAHRPAHRQPCALPGGRHHRPAEHRPPADSQVLATGRRPAT